MLTQSVGEGDVFHIDPRMFVVTHLLLFQMGVTRKDSCLMVTEFHLSRLLVMCVAFLCVKIVFITFMTTEAVRILLNPSMFVNF